MCDKMCKLGKDLTDILLNNGKSQHECIFLYGGTPNSTCPQGLEYCDNLFAVRCNQYKVHWFVNTFCLLVCFV